MSITEKKIAVFTDVHSNLPAIKAVLEDIDKEKCDYVFNLGDMLAIGPYPKETLDYIMKYENIITVSGNHEEYYLDGLDQPPSYMAEGEVRHQKWVHQQLDEHHKEFVNDLPYLIEKKFLGVTIVFVHYPYKKEFEDLVDIKVCDIICCGHKHLSKDFYSTQDNTRYVNPGSLGCYHDDFARYCIIKVDESGYEVDYRRIKYDKTKVMKELISRDVPEKCFVGKIFFGVDLNNYF